MIFPLDQDVPDSIARVVQQAGHEVHRLREMLPGDSPDEAVLAFAHSRGALLVTCNRDDFLSLAKSKPHVGIIVLIRRPTRIAECSAFLPLLQAAGETGLRDNINFA
jgi:predicted nuclease of predicted toxin-antitoxin system